MPADHSRGVIAVESQQQAHRLRHVISQLVEQIPASGIRVRREAGYAATWRALERAPWRGEFDPIEGVILHEEMELQSAAE
jgi:hypothetical protein